MSKIQDKQSLQAYQLASLLGSAGSMYGYHNPAQAGFAASMTDSAKGSIAAQNEYMQRKAAREGQSSGIGKLAGTLAGAGIGALAGGPAGMVEGAAIGGGLGGAGEDVSKGNYTGAGQSLASGLTSYAAAGTPTGSGGTLEPVAATGAATSTAEQAGRSALSLAPAAQDSADPALTARNTPEQIAADRAAHMGSSTSDMAPVGGTSTSPNMAARKEGLTKLDFKNADQVQQHGYMSVMLDAGVQPSHEQWSAMSPADQKYWESRGVTPPQSKFNQYLSAASSVARTLYPGGGY